MAKKMDISKIWARGENEGFTPYMIATLINLELASKDLEQIRPQMMYNYDRNGVINGTKRQNDERGYTTNEVLEFINRFVAMRVAKGKTNRKAPIVASSFTVEDVESASEYMAESNPELPILN